MRKTVRTGFWFFGMAVLVMLAAALYWQAALPDEYTVTRAAAYLCPAISPPYMVGKAPQPAAGKR